MTTMKKFNDSMIRRHNLPEDVFGLIHDLAYDHAGRDRWQYRGRARRILTTTDGDSAMQPTLQSGSEKRKEKR
jgi:hypothetical protein